MQRIYLHSHSNNFCSIFYAHDHFTISQPLAILKILQKSTYMSTRSRVKHPTGCRRNRKVCFYDEHTFRSSTFLLVLQDRQVSRAVLLPMAISITMEIFFLYQRSFSSEPPSSPSFCSPFSIFLWTFLLFSRLSLERSPLHNKHRVPWTLQDTLSSNQHVDQLIDGVLDLIHIEVYNKLSIWISQGLQDQINL